MEDLPYQKLDHACQLAQEKSGYCSTRFHEHLRDEFISQTGGKRPYQWQLDAAEAFDLGLHCTILAGTGAGKTLPFIMPAFVNPRNVYIIVSPLNALEEDQVKFFIFRAPRGLTLNSYKGKEIPSTWIKCCGCQW